MLAYYGAEWHPDWPPMLAHTRLLGACRWCSAPSRPAPNGLCAVCRTLLRRTKSPLTSLEFVSVATTADALFGRLAAWKERRGGRACALELAFGPELGQPYAAMLSAYFEAHAHRLLGDDVTVVVAPTSVPVVSRALRLAARQGWFAFDVRNVATRVRGRRQREASQAERLKRDPSDYLMTRSITGRVVLVDDVYVSGATMHSFARALLDAGAREVRGVALLRSATWHAADAVVRDGAAWSPGASDVRLRSDVVFPAWPAAA